MAAASSRSAWLRVSQYRISRLADSVASRAARSESPDLVAATAFRLASIAACRSAWLPVSRYFSKVNCPNLAHRHAASLRFQGEVSLAPAPAKNTHASRSASSRDRWYLRFRWMARFVMILARSELSSGVLLYACRPRAIASSRSAGSPAAENRWLKQIARFPRHRVYSSLPTGAAATARSYAAIAESSAAGLFRHWYIRSANSARVPWTSLPSHEAERSRAECPRLLLERPPADNAATRRPAKCAGSEESYDAALALLSSRP